MISTEKLYAATDAGLRILALHFPAVEEAARANKPFKAREEERTPSARVKLYDRKGCPVWMFTDFGDNSERAKSPIDVHMEKTGLRFTEAILDLAAIFNVTDEINRSVNRPDIRKERANPDQADGSWDKEINQRFTERECKTMGPRVTVETLESLHWHRAEYVVGVKNREAVYKHSNENYPIFVRECWFVNEHGKADCFYKVYEPLNPEKQWRFQYQPAGKKPRCYINGLFELEAAYKKFNDEAEKKWNSDPANENKPYREKKLPEAIICSGERDALCVRSLGHHPLWFNSETYSPSEEEWRKITKYAETIYNIPDIDATGRLKGTELALKYIDIHTIWLPENLTAYRDNRGKPRKDFRDWMEIYDRSSDFHGLMNLATPAKFWTETWSDKAKKYKYALDISCLHEFLMLNGFFTLKDKHAPGTQFVRMQGNIVKHVTAKEIREFVLNWSIDTKQPRELRNQILQDSKLSAQYLEALREVDPDFTNYTERSQFFYFPKFTVEVTGKEIIQHDSRSASTGRYVWEENVIGHNIKFLPDMFTITHPEGQCESEDFNIEVAENQPSNYFKYLINSSRIHWRKELEEHLNALPQEEAEAYRAAHRFDIAGPALTAAEIQEQKQCLINKIFTIGFMMHRYKSESRAWAPFVMDNVVGENDQCNGRSGKSFMFRALSNFTRWLKFSGRNPKLLENQFAFEQVSKHLGIVVVDDCDEYLPFKQFYDNITSDITINTKNVSTYTLAFQDAPKFAFTTNYVPKEFDGSSVGRMLFVVFSDYYHQRTEDNDYLETRKISTDFNKDLFGSGYTEAEWEADINFVLQCVKFYLSVAPLNVKIEPQMGNIIFRKYLRDMSDNFREWAEGYFSIDENGNGDNVNREIVREDAFEAYKRFSGVSKITMQKFTKSLKGFCFTCDYIDCMNPEELHNSGSRIMRRVEDPISHKKIQKEMIYLRTTKEAERLKNPPPPPPTQEALKL
ncbi:MAG: hypothetical protein NC102_03215 [Clostridium sp.]|nr:hypothetical protein [Clostridium sp.]